MTLKTEAREHFGEQAEMEESILRNEPEDEADSILAERTREFRAALFRAGRYDPSQPLKGI
jgi:hypothetical protein